MSSSAPPPPTGDSAAGSAQQQQSEAAPPPAGNPTTSTSQGGNLQQQETSNPIDDTIAFDPNVVGDLEDEHDSTADVDSLRESTASITSSILQYRNINGRAYQSSSTTEYWAPTDQKHVEGMDISHQFTLMLFDDKLFLAPLTKEPQAILDIGTGSGIWAIDAADEFPSAEVIATDISAVQPHWAPPNLSFQIDDAQLEWTFKRDYFDLIHIRYLYGGIDDWQRLYNQAFTACKPGGWFENVEIDLQTRSENPKITNDPDHIFQHWTKLFFQAGEKVGRTFKIGQDGLMPVWMEKAGFVDVVHKQWKVPVGGWPADPKLKQIGLYNGAFIDQSLDGFAVFPIGQILGWSFEEVMVLVSKMRATIKEPRALPYYNVHVVYGRKPELS